VTRFLARRARAAFELWLRFRGWPWCRRVSLLIDRLVVSEERMG
jgi:hypothetical protein